MSNFLTRINENAPSTNMTGSTNETNATNATNEANATNMTDSTNEVNAAIIRAHAAKIVNVERRRKQRGMNPNHPDYDSW